MPARRRTAPPATKRDGSRDRQPRALAQDALRAAKLSRIPGVTIAVACARFGVARAAVARARKLPETDPSLAEIALAALSCNGLVAAGKLAGLDAIAGWIDYIDHDGCDVAGVRRLLDELVRDGLLAIEGDEWRLPKAWP